MLEPRRHILSCNTTFQAWYLQQYVCDAEGASRPLKSQLLLIPHFSKGPDATPNPICLVWSLDWNV